MKLIAKNITEEPTTITINYETADGAEVLKKYIEPMCEIEIVLPDRVTALSVFSEFPGSVIITGVI